MIAYIPYGKIILVNTECSYTDSRISCLVFDIICIVSRPTRDYVTMRHYLVTNKMGYVASALTIWNTYGLLLQIGEYHKQSAFTGRILTPQNVTQRNRNNICIFNNMYRHVSQSASSLNLYHNIDMISELTHP